MATKGINNLENSQPIYPFNGHIKTADQRTLYSNTVIGTLAVDGWAVTFGTRRGLGRLRSTSYIRCDTIITCAH